MQVASRSSRKTTPTEAKRLKAQWALAHLIRLDERFAQQLGLLDNGGSWEEFLATGEVESWLHFGEGLEMFGAFFC